LLIGASATLPRASSALLYFDVLLVLIVAVPALAAGVPALGYTVGGAAWILGRVGSAIAQRRIAEVKDFRRQMGLGMASSMLRVWLLACAIIVVGLAGTRADGLTAALVVFGAFSVYFAGSAFGHWAQRGSTEAR
jgi:hypothetical protein